MACPAVHRPGSGLHAAHHRVVLQRRKLLKGKGTPCVTFRLVVVSLRRPGQSPVPGTNPVPVCQPALSICGAKLEDSE